MINHDCTSLEWITRVSALHNNADKILVEKVIRALMLHEGLAVSGLDFCFKGGTATMLLLEKPRRMSIDIDIIVPDANADIPATLDKVCAQQGFTGWTVVERQNKGLIHKTHYRLHFLSNVSRAREQFILLDVLHEQVGYSKTIQKPLTSSFIENEDAAVLVTMPDINSITGDKLTAFSPNTIGIPYSKGGHDRGMEIIKQLYDCWTLLQEMRDYETVAEVYYRVSQIELGYRGLKLAPADALKDTIDSCLCIMGRGGIRPAEYSNFLAGIGAIQGHIFNGRLNGENAGLLACEILYLAACLLTGQKSYDRVGDADAFIDRELAMKGIKRIRYIRNVDPRAYAYLVKAIDLLQAAGYYTDSIL